TQHSTSPTAGVPQDSARFAIAGGRLNSASQAAGAWVLRGPDDADFYHGKLHGAPPRTAARRCAPWRTGTRGLNEQTQTRKTGAQLPPQQRIGCESKPPWPSMSRL